MRNKGLFDGLIAILEDTRDVVGIGMVDDVGRDLKEISI